MEKVKKELSSFIKYCDDHPDERFWQALRNWSGFKFILKADKLWDAGDATVPDHYVGIEDTFYMNDCNHECTSDCRRNGCPCDEHHHQ